MKFTVDIDSENDAVQEVHHVVDILHDIVQELMAGEKSGILRDYNGNTVGSFQLEETVNASRNAG